MTGDVTRDATRDVTRIMTREVSRDGAANITNARGDDARDRISKKDVTGEST